MKFIDLFAGIGGIRLGFESVGGQCVFSSEWDEQGHPSFLVYSLLESNSFSYWRVTEIAKAILLHATFKK